MKMCGKERSKKEVKQVEKKIEKEGKGDGFLDTLCLEQFFCCLNRLKVE